MENHLLKHSLWFSKYFTVE